MSRIQLYSNEFITVDYHSDKKIIYHTIHKPMGKEQIDIYKQALNAGTNAMEKYGVSKWLSDDRKNGPLPDELEGWGTDTWIPKTLEAGWKYWANVVPTEIHAAGTFVPVIEALYALGLRMRVFSHAEEALVWLDSVD